MIGTRLPGYIGRSTLAPPPSPLIDRYSAGVTTPHTDRPIEFIARGVLRHGSAVLACRNLKHGYLYLPGGHVDFGEPAGRAAEREFEEETGLKVRSGACVLVSEGLFETGKGKKHHEVNLVFHVEHTGDAWPPEEPPPTVPSREADLGFEWVDLASVADLDFRPEPVQAWLASGGAVDPAATPCVWVSSMPR